MELNMFSAIALPIGSAVLAVLGAFLVAVYPYYDVWKRNREVNIQKQLRREAGRQIVSSVNSNDQSFHVDESLAALFSRMDQLGMALNIDASGCVEDCGQ